MFQKKRIIATILTLFVLSLMLVSGCGNKKEQTSDPPKAAQKQETGLLSVELNYQMEALGNGKYKISCTTNLPDNMEMMVSLSNQKSVRKQLGISEDLPADKLSDEQFKKLTSMSFTAQSKIKVKDGKFAATLGGEKLIPDEYDLSISSSAMKLQSDETVKKKLGMRGENLTGKYVVDGTLGKTVKLSDKVRCDK